MAVRWSLEGRAAAPREPQEELVRLCPGCETIVPLGVSTCPECGHAFTEAPPREIDGIEPGAITAIDHEAILRLREMPYAQVLASARTFDDLKMIALARRYADGWVYHQARERGIAIPRREREGLLPVGDGGPT